MKTIALIPARGGSKRIVDKNIRLLANRPLIEHTIQQAEQSQNIEQCFVSTDDDKIANISKKCGAKVVSRPAELATDTAKSSDVVKHFHRYYCENYGNYDLLVLLQATVPLRKVKTIDLAIESFISQKNLYDSLMPLKKLKLKTGTIVDGCYIPKYQGEIRSQDIDYTYLESGTIFIYRFSMLKKENIYGKRIMPFIIEDESETIDIDTEQDFKKAEIYLQMQESK